MVQYLLPPDLIQSQLSTIDLLTAMFPSAGELDISASTTEAIEQLRAWCEDPNPNTADPPFKIPSSLQMSVHAPTIEDGKTIQVNISIPLNSETLAEDLEPPPLTYTLRQPPWMSKAEVAKFSAAMPSDDVFAAFEYIQEEALHFSDTQQQLPSPGEEPEATKSGPIVRVWLYFPSLSTRAKRTDMVTHAPDYSLTGFVLAGKPGVLCLEGASRGIDAYMSFIKTHSWGDIPSHQKKVSERFRETEGVERVFAGMEEITDSLGERGGQRANRGDMQALEAWLKGKGLGEAFEKVIF
ncbi:ubiquitin-conjugating enzyme/RWD-like protein [Aspergillus crustosus]